MKSKKNLKVFLVFNGIGEIISSRIIETMINQGIKKNEIYILKPRKYSLSLLKEFNTIRFENIDFENKKFYKLNLKVLIRSFMHIVHRKNKLLLMFFVRMAYLPISFSKLILINETLVKSDSFLLKENLSIYTPNTRLHLFQYLVCMANNFEYHLIEEGKLSFKEESLISINYKNKKIDEILNDFLISIIYNFLIISKLLLDISRLGLVKRKLPLKYLRKYIKAPIFNLNFLEIKNKIPVTINKISKNAFSNINIKSQLIYSKKSKIEISTLQRFNKIYTQKNLYYLYILSGDNIPILKKEFDYEILKNIDKAKLLIRPHPALYSKSIKIIDKILSLDLDKANIKLSEELWKYPIELIANISCFKIIYPKSNKSSVSFYLKNQLM